MLFKPAANPPLDGFSVANVNRLPNLIPIPTPADSPAVIMSFISDYVQKHLSHPNTVEPFTLFTSLQRLELLKRAAVDIKPIYPIQPISTVFGVIDETIIKELSEEFWQSLDDSERAQWVALANDVQQLCCDVYVDDIRRISQNLFGEWSDGTGTILPAGWIDLRVQRITTKCLLRSYKLGAIPPIDVNTYWGSMINETSASPSNNLENDSLDANASWNEAYGHWREEDWKALATAATAIDLRARSLLHFRISTPESINGNMELEDGTESPSGLEPSDANPEPKLECESESDEY